MKILTYEVEEKALNKVQLNFNFQLNGPVNLTAEFNWKLKFSFVKRANAIHV